MDWETAAKTIAALTPAEFSRRWTQLKGKQADEALRMRWRYRVDEFLRYCFPRLFSRPWNRYHLEVLNREKLAFHQRSGRNLFRTTAAPRGIAKTTLAKGDIVHDVVYGIEQYILVVSAETKLARNIAKHLLRIFQDKKSRLSQLYGPFEVIGGVEGFSVSVRGRAPIGIFPRSMSTQIRGANEDGARPSRILVDDGEHPKRVKNPDLRAEDWQFLQDDIIKSAPIEGGLILDWNGTVLHRDSVLAKLLKDAGWKASFYQAVEAWPERTDLWERCGRIWKDLGLGDIEVRRQCALAFYAANKAEMDRGVRVLDENALPIFRCYEAIWSGGLRSFLREFQNQPTSDGASLFESSKFKRFHLHNGWIIVDGRQRVKLSDLRIALRLDPIPGKELSGFDEDGPGAGDRAAIAVVGRDGQGYGYVLAVWGKRCKDSVQLATLWALAEHWSCGNPCKATIESNGFQRLLGRAFRTQQKARREAGKYWQVAVEDDNSSTDKNDRIASLEIPTSNDWLLFNDAISPEVFQEADDFPNGDHDDYWDAIEGAWRNSGPPPKTNLLSSEPLL